MSSNIRLQKTCQHCGNRFTAKTTVTQFCSDTCAKRAYKQRKRNEKIEVAIKEETEKALYNPAIAQKEFLTVEEACQLINASRWTIYRLIEKGEIAHSMVGRHRRLKAEDVFAYKAERDKVRSKAMDDLIADGAGRY